MNRLIVAVVVGWLSWISGQASADETDTSSMQCSVDKYGMMKCPGDFRSDCEKRMEEAMRAHDGLGQADKEMNAKNPWEVTSDYTLTNDTQCGMVLCGGGSDEVCYRKCNYESHKPDKRTEEQRLDDEIKEIEKRRVALREREDKQRKWERVQADNKALHDLATKLWNDARTCWRNP